MKKKKSAYALRELYQYEIINTEKHPEKFHNKNK